MSATFAWACDNGPATGSPAAGLFRTNPISDVNWKNIDDATTVYTAAPIVAGFNSFERWIFGAFSGSYTSIASGLFQHTAGVLPANTFLYGGVTTNYTTPGVVTNSILTTNMTSTASIGTGIIVLFGITGPQASGKVGITTSNPAYTQYLVTQLRTNSSASVGATTGVVLTLQYQET